MIVPLPTSLFNKILQNCRCFCVINCCTAEVDMLDETSQTPDEGSEEWYISRQTRGIACLFYFTTYYLTLFLAQKKYQTFRNREDKPQNPERRLLLYHK